MRNANVAPRAGLLLLTLAGAAAIALGLPGAAGAQALDGGIGGDVVALDAWDWLGLVARLVAVLVVIWAAFWGVRWYGRRTQTTGGRGELEVLETRALGPNRSLQLVRVGRRAVLVGVTPERINQLIEIDDPEEVERIARAIEAQRASAPGFARLTGSISRLTLPSRKPRTPQTAGRGRARTQQDQRAPAPRGGEDFAPPVAGAQQLQAGAAYRQARIAELQRAVEDARRSTSFESLGPAEPFERAR